jgi:hypothetical protein
MKLASYSKIVLQLRRRILGNGSKGEFNYTSVVGVSTTFMPILLSGINLNQGSMCHDWRRKMLSKLALGVIGVALVAILSLGYAGYSALNPHTMTVTGQQFVTNVQTGTTTVTSANMVNSQVMQTASQNALVTATNGYAAQQNCAGGSTSYGCNWPYNYDACWGTGQGTSGVACDGYLIQGPNGCVELAVPTDTVAQPAYNHYTLQNLPSSYPSIGTWVVVNGQLMSGANSGTGSSSNNQSTGACSTMIISVSSVQQTNPPPAP